VAVAAVVDQVKVQLEHHLTHCELVHKAALVQIVIRWELTAVAMVAAAVVHKAVTAEIIPVQEMQEVFQVLEARQLADLLMQQAAVLAARPELDQLQEIIIPQFMMLPQAALAVLHTQSARIYAYK
jgi:hypothetical protein